MHAPDAPHAPDEPSVLDALRKCTSFPTEKQIAKKIEQSHLQGEQGELCFLEAPWDAYHVEFTALDYQLPELLQAFFNVLEKHKDFNNARKFKGVLITNKYIHELCAVRLVNNPKTPTAGFNLICRLSGQLYHQPHYFAPDASWLVCSSTAVSCNTNLKPNNVHCLTILLKVCQTLPTRPTKSTRPAKPPTNPKHFCATCLTNQNNQINQINQTRQSEQGSKSITVAWDYIVANPDGLP